MCVWAVSKDVKLVSYCRGVWHSCPTTLNEAVGMSGKQDLANLVYLHSDDFFCLKKLLFTIPWNIHYHELGIERAISPVKVCVCVFKIMKKLDMLHKKFTYR